MARRYKTIKEVPTEFIDAWESAVRDGKLELALATKGEAISMRIRLYMARQAMIREAPELYNMLSGYEVTLMEMGPSEFVLDLHQAAWVKSLKDALAKSSLAKRKDGGTLDKTAVPATVAPTAPPVLPTRAPHSQTTRQADALAAFLGTGASQVKQKP